MVRQSGSMARQEATCIDSREKGTFCSMTRWSSVLMASIMSSKVPSRLNGALPTSMKNSTTPRDHKSTL